MTVKARQNGGGEGRGIYLEMGGFTIYIEVFLKILHDAVYEKNLDVFIFSLLTNTCSKI